jgi:putative heme-binding domain-containing protein
VAELDNPNNDRQQQIVYAYALSNLPAGWDDASREQMVGWFEKVFHEGWKGGRSYGGYIRGFQDDFLAHQPESPRMLAEARLSALEPPEVALLPDGAPPPQNGQISTEELFEELVYNPRNFEGDAGAGTIAYRKALCVACHTFGPIGNEVGPDLTTVNTRFTRQDLVRAVMYPNETISDLWQMEAITRTNGEVVSGILYNETAQEVIVQIPAGPQVTIPKADIASRARSEVSPMPEGLLNYLNGNEQRALLMLLEAGPDAIPESALTRINGS